MGNWLNMKEKQKKKKVNTDRKDEYLYSIYSIYDPVNKFIND